MCPLRLAPLATAIIGFLLCAGPSQAQQIECNASTTKTITTATDTQLVAAPRPGLAVYICDYEFSFGGTGNAFLETATAGTCGGTLTQISNVWYGAASVTKPGGNAIYRGMTTGDLQLCVNTSAAVNFSITVYYAVQ